MWPTSAVTGARNHELANLVPAPGLDAAWSARAMQREALWRRSGTIPLMRIAFGTDEKTELTQAITGALAEWGHEVSVVGEGGPWPEVGRGVGEAVAGGEVDRGVVCCWTGTGVSMAANKVAGVRAALCTDAATARGARRWNDANVLALSLRLTSPEVAREILDAFLTADTEPEEAEQIAKLG